jgi:tetratricopeptide (TPR) repeat protein
VIGWMLVTTGAAALWWAERLRRRRWRDRWNDALARSDWPALEAMVRRVQPHVPHPAQRARLQMYLAQVVHHQERPHDAVAALDPSLAKHLPALELAHWLINRGYYLALADRFDEALGELERAEIILQGEEAVDARLNYTCVLGNRGLVALRRGQPHEAEPLIERAHREAQAIVETLDDGDARLKHTRGWHAERFVWLSEIAQLRGDDELARARLREAAKVDDGHWATLARRKLDAP